MIGTGTGESFSEVATADLDDCDDADGGLWACSVSGRPLSPHWAGLALALGVPLLFRRRRSI